MRVTVVCFGALREFLPAGSSSNELSLEVPEDTTLREVVQRLAAPTHLVFSALVGDERADLDETLPDGARVTLMPPFTGGRGED
ncbi:MAG: MoaD/ThiS family protein [Actinomycetota bacterium]|nr:MoaD/ThiS family protein [Actinomycetota bacterium]